MKEVFSEGYSIHRDLFYSTAVLQQFQCIYGWGSVIFVPMIFLSGLVLAHLVPSLCKKGITEIPETFGIRNHSEVFSIICFFRQLSIKRSVSCYHRDGIGKETCLHVRGDWKELMNKWRVTTHGAGVDQKEVPSMGCMVHWILLGQLVFGLLTILFYQVRG